MKGPAAGWQSERADAWRSGRWGACHLAGAPALLVTRSRRFFRWSTPSLMRTLPAFLAFVGALALGLAGCGGNKNAIVVYSPHGRDLLSGFAATFEQAHPGTDVQWVDMGS